MCFSLKGFGRVLSYVHDRIFRRELECEEGVVAGGEVELLPKEPLYINNKAGHNK